MTQQEQEKMAALEAEIIKLRQDVITLTEKIIILLKNKTAPIVKKILVIRPYHPLVIFLFQRQKASVCLVHSKAAVNLVILEQR